MDGDETNEPLTLDALGDLSARNDEELLWLRERLIMDVERIQQESAQAQEEIKNLNRRRHELKAESAQRARALRAVKHVLRQRRAHEDSFDDAELEAR